MTRSGLTLLLISICLSCSNKIDRSDWVIDSEGDNPGTETLTNFAAGKFYLFDCDALAGYSDENPVSPWSSGTKLTDEVSADTKGKGSLCWQSDEVAVTLDLGSVRKVKTVRVHAISDGASCNFPSRATVRISSDNRSWETVPGKISFGSSSTGGAWGSLSTNEEECRYMKLILSKPSGAGMFAIDEIEALGEYVPSPKYVPSSGAYHGAFNNSTSFADNKDISIIVKTPTCPVETYEALVGKKLSMMLWYQNMTEGRNFSEIKNVRDSYWGLNYDGKYRFMIYGWLPLISSAAQASGALDEYHKAYFQEVAQAPVKEKGPIWFRPANEMNGGWVPYYNDPGNYVKAWRRMYNIAEQYGVTAFNVFVWSPNSYDSPATATNKMEKYYPGDIYVDWLGISCYPGSKSGKAENYRYPSYLLNAIEKISETKPVMISEGAYGSDYGQSAANEASASNYACDHLRWVEEWFGLKTTHPRVKAVIWENHLSETQGDRRIHKDASALAKYRELVSDPYWLGTIPQEVYTEIERRKNE